MGSYFHTNELVFSSTHIGVPLKGFKQRSYSSFDELALMGGKGT